MPAPDNFPEAGRTHPIVLPDGSPHLGTVFLNQVITHPRCEIGDYTYYSDFDPPADTADYVARLAPYLFEFSAERLVIGRFARLRMG